MNTSLKCLLLACSMLAVGAARADDDDHDVEGRVQAIDRASGSFVVQGRSFHVTRSTEFDDGLDSFSSLRVGDRVEVEYRMRQGRRIATEVERDD